MVDLIKTYETAGLQLDGKELPDHLCVVLEFASTQPPAIAREFLGEMAHILNAIFSALRQRDSAYATLVAAVLELAGQRARGRAGAARRTAGCQLGRAGRLRRLLQPRPGRARPAATGAHRAPTPIANPRSARMTALDTFLFGYYPYICLTVFLLGSLIRFDREQYTWKSDSLAAAARRPAALGQQPVPRRRAVPVLRPLRGHADAALRLRALHQRRRQAADGDGLGRRVRRCWASSASRLLLHRRLSDPRIRVNSRTSDIVLLALLWLQLALGLATIPLSAQHLDGSMMMRLAEWAQRIVTFRAGAVDLLADAGWVFKAHMFLGMSLFLVFPFTRLVHVWSGFGTLAYVVRPYQVVRTRRALRRLPAATPAPQGAARPAPALAPSRRTT